MQNDLKAKQSAMIGQAAQAPTITERLRSERDQLQERLDQIDEALEALQDNNEVARVVDAISRLTPMY